MENKTSSACYCYFVWGTKISLLTFIVKNALRIHSPEISGTGEKDRTQKK